MTSQRSRLTPHMTDYEDFVDRGEMRWLPYLMFFHRNNYRSRTVNTDRLGFRHGFGPDGPLSTSSDLSGFPAVNLLVGSSTALGIGSTSDTATISSMLTRRSPRVPWLNFGGCGYSTTQEFLLFSLHRHLLGTIDNIVIVTGLNDLALTGLPGLQGDFGGFFFSGDFFSKMDELRHEHEKSKRFPLRPKSRYRIDPGIAPPPGERVALACAQISRSLDNWRAMADACGARLSFVMQPFSTWVRQQETVEERALFHELDTNGSDSWKLYVPVAGEDVGRRYASGLEKLCTERSIEFLDMNIELAKATSEDQWLFVDRAHFNDTGYAAVADIIADSFDLN